jgi:hypothetical protein
MFSMNDAMLGANGMIIFPTSNGICSEAFKKQQVVFFNDFVPMSNILYAKDVDNIQGLK